MPGISSYQDALRSIPKSNPASATKDGLEHFLERDFFGAKLPKKGSTITITASVISIGDKVAVKPTKAVISVPEEQDMAEDESEDDEDADEEGED